MSICNDPIAKHTCHILKDAGKECYVVGGAVRDEMMGVEPHDLDFSTNATPDEVMRIFRDEGCAVIPTGLKHGTVTAICDPIGKDGVRADVAVEITTYRQDGEYEEGGRRPKNVKFVDTIEEDLARRDLTINAMAKDPLTCKLVDVFDGQGDIQRRLVKSVGDPIERMATAPDRDGLRAFRAARFAARFGFDIHPETRVAMSDPRVHEVVTKKVSTERIREEFLKAFSADRPEEFARILADTGLLYLTIPEMREMRGMPQPEEHHAHDVWGHTLAALKAAKKEPFSRWMAFTHDIAKPATYNGDPQNPHFYGHDRVGGEVIETVMRRMKGWPREQIRDAKSLIKNHLIFYNPDWTDAQLRRWIKRVTPDLVHAQIDLARADLIGHGPHKAQELAYYDDLERRIAAIPEPPRITLAGLAVNGHDMMNLGLVKRQIGDTLSYLLERVIENPELNDRDRLLAIAKARMEEK